MTPEVAEHYEMRDPCQRCGASNGYIAPTGAQDCVYCSTCNTYAYNAPRRETGGPVRATSRSPLAPSKRARCLRIFDNTCVSCGARPPNVELHIGHLVPRSYLIEEGWAERDADNDLNLAPMCAECNLGIGSNPVALGLMARALRTSIASAR